VKKVLVSSVVEVAVTTEDAKEDLLNGINSPPNPTSPHLDRGICSSLVLGSLCSTAVPGGFLIMGGCATVKEQCPPPELVGQSCVNTGSAGAYVLAQATDVTVKKAAADDDVVTPQTSSLPKKPQQATFQGCCVTYAADKRANSKTSSLKSTCKKIRVGKRYTSNGKTLTMDPLKQLSSCKCYNIREYVKTDMYTRPNKYGTQHYLAEYPVTIGVATKVGRGGGVAVWVGRARCRQIMVYSPAAVAPLNPYLLCLSLADPHPPHQPLATPPHPQTCIPKKGRKTCKKQFVRAGTATVDCAAGSLQVNFTSEAGIVLGRAYDVVATCEVSALSDMSSCGVDNAGSTVKVASGAATALASTEWDSNCVCTRTRRRPTLKVTVPEVIVGAACMN